MSPLRASRLAAWIAIFAMALAALAPTLSRIGVGFGEPRCLG